MIGGRCSVGLGGGGVRRGWGGGGAKVRCRPGV